MNQKTEDVMLELMPCKHRGVKTDMLRCTGCGDTKNRVGVFECQLHELCTLRRCSRDTNNCHSCGDRKDN